MKKILMTAVLASALMGGTLRADTYKVDATHATIGFRVSHLVISKVNGQFNDYDATLELADGKTLTGATATIKTASIDTEVAKRDDHLRSPDFFDAAKYPEITFTSKKVTANNIFGDLTIRGITKEVSLRYTLSGPVKDPWGNTKVGLEATGTISRKEFGLTWNQMLEAGGAVVGDEVELLINVEAARQ